MKKKKSSPILKGIAASPGISIGTAFVLERARITIPRYWISNNEVEKENKRFKKAVQKTKEELQNIKEKLCKFDGGDQIRILDSYSLILQDDLLVKNTLNSIKSDLINAEWALSQNLDAIKKTFEEIDVTYFKERNSDVDYVGQQIIKHLIGHQEEAFNQIPKHNIIISHDLSPADTAQLMKFKVKGFVTELGGKTSHTAIISRALEIPSIVGCPLASSQIRSGDTVIVDGNAGEVIVNPNTRTLNLYEKKLQSCLESERILLRNIHKPAETQDGRRIRLSANMEILEELDSVKEHGAEGIGLYRSEFLYLNRRELPTEEELFQNFKAVLKRVYPNFATIRTFDMGGDKIPIHHQFEKEEINPALGLRAIRLCLKEMGLFKTQLRALLRASAFGKLKILLPMISNLEELYAAKTTFEKIKKELLRKKIDFDPNVKLGIMIEVPSAVMIANELAKEVDFFSIGTNDLIQYSIAIDRTNENVAYLYQPLHPAILRMLKMIISAALKEQIEVSVCGEMAGEPLCILILLGYGLSELSMNALSIPKVKEIIRSVDYYTARSLLEKVMDMNSADKIEKFVRKEMHKILDADLKKYIPSL